MPPRRPLSYIRDPMIDGSNDSASLTPDDWVWTNSPSGLDTNFEPPRHYNTFGATGLTGGGSDSAFIGFDSGISPEELYNGNGVNLGPSGQLSLLSGGQGQGMET
ncbi:hypothetical protein VMCG_05374 [Cytospora schulzeri]|uniref:Uncharacterized protein n=1 Tax=Cytospora schulzeri TaxID=448051 RepID=A0A423WK53_9PEZI|nr:hypothetical protein VMCG_05374 [Valsa malicola]